MTKIFNFPLLLISMCILLSSISAGNADDYHVYVGTYTKGESEGIYNFRFNSDTGSFSDVNLAAKASNPSFLAIHPSSDSLFAVLEDSNWDGVENSGGIASYQLDRKTGDLEFVAAKPTYGAHPCHLEVHPKGTYVFFANYTGGSIGAYAIKGSRNLGSLTGFVQHTGGSIHRTRQKSPHGHSIHLAPGGKFLMSADLGVDCIWVHSFNPVDGTIGDHHPSKIPVRPGSGPRHFAFNPTSDQVLVLNEMSSELSSYQYNKKKGTLAFQDKLKTLPTDYKKNNSTAEVVFHPNGKFSYSSNRGHDSIAVFETSKKGKLNRVQVIKTGGKTPRNFNLDPTGNWLLAANQNSNTITLFKVDSKSGKLTAFGEPIHIPNPVCVRFVKIRE